MPKKSGAEFRKQKKKREEERKKLANTWQKWLNRKEDEEQHPGAPGSDCSGSEECYNRDNEDEHTKSEPEQDVVVVVQQEWVSTENNEGNNGTLDGTETSETNLINQCDPATWKRPYSNAFITTIVELGPEHDLSADFSKSADHEGRQFSIKWFHKIMPNGETVKRDWLMYSRYKGSLFCFPCLLFAKFRDRRPLLCDPDYGFSKWKKLNPKIPEHENSIDHRNSYITWKEFEKRIVRSSN